MPPSPTIPMVSPLISRRLSVMFHGWSRPFPKRRAERAFMYASSTCFQVCWLVWTAYLFRPWARERMSPIAVSEIPGA